MKRLSSLIVLLFLAVPAFAAADVSGKWSGSFQITRPDGALSDQKIVMSLTDKNDVVTGAVGPSADTLQPIRKGKMTGDKLVFEMTTADQADVTFTLTLADGHLKGDASAVYKARTLKGVVDATREK